MVRAQPGDELFILQWNKAGQLKPSKPCDYCMTAIKRAGIRRIYYYDNNLELVRQRI